MTTSIFVTGPFSSEQATATAKKLNATCKGGARGCWFELAFSTKAEAEAAMKKLGKKAQTSAEFKAVRRQAKNEFLVRSMGVDGARAYALNHGLKDTLAFISALQTPCQTSPFITAR